MDERRKGESKETPERTCFQCFNVDRETQQLHGGGSCTKGPVRHWNYIVDIIMKCYFRVNYYSEIFCTGGSVQSIVA